MSYAEQAEQAFDDLSEWLAGELTRVRGDHPAESAVLEAAVQRYAEARKLVDPEEPYSYVTHFFSADGVGWEKARTPALRRIAGITPEEGQRWSEGLGDVAMKLEAAMFAEG